MMANSFASNASKFAGSMRQPSKSQPSSVNMVWGTDKAKIQQYWLENAADPSRPQQDTRDLTRFDTNSWFHVATA